MSARLFSLETGYAVGEKAKNGAGEIGKISTSEASLDYCSARFARPFFFSHADFPFFPHCGAWSLATRVCASLSASRDAAKTSQAEKETRVIWARKEVV